MENISDKHNMRWFCVKHLHDVIFSLRGEDLVHKSSLTPPRFIDIPVEIQESERPCTYVRGVDFASLFTILRLNFGTVSMVSYFFCKKYCF